MGKGLTQQGENRETPKQRSDRLKNEVIKAVERLWTWAQVEEIFGEIVIKAHFEDGHAIRLYFSPTEMKM